MQHYAPQFQKRWNRFARPVGGSWRVDETSIKVRGRWTYLYRAVDARGKTIDFRLSPKRDVAAAKAFFRKAFTTQGCMPRTITLGGVELIHRIRKGQFALGRLRISGTTTPEIWNAVLAA